MATSIATQLSALLGPESVLTDDTDRRVFSQDIAGPREHVATCVIRPRSVEQLCAAVAASTAAGIASVPRGGGASYTGGYVPDRDTCVLIHTRGLGRVVEVNTADMYVTVEAGCTWESLLAALEPHGVRTPFWGPLSGATATIGGSLSQNSILWGSARYGVSAETVLALEVVLAEARCCARAPRRSARRDRSSVTTAPTSRACSSAIPAPWASRRGRRSS